VAKWKYKLERWDLWAQAGSENVEDSLNALGELGWELVGVQDVRGYPYAVLKHSAYG
jgi:hypothetical protein